jgi:hypothetical protein
LTGLIALECRSSSKEIKDIALYPLSSRRQSDDFHHCKFYSKKISLVPEVLLESNVTNDPLAFFSLATKVRRRDGRFWCGGIGIPDIAAF